MDEHSNIPLKDQLAFQLALPFVVFIVAVLAVLSTATIYSFLSNRAEALSIPSTIASNRAQAIGTFFGNLDLNLRLAADSFGDSPNPNGQEIFFLQNFVKQNFAILEFTIFSSEGNEIYRLVKPTVGAVTPKQASIRDADYFKNVIDRGADYISAPGTSIYGTPYVFWAYPIKDSVGHTFGVLRATIDISSLWGMIAEQRIVDNSNIYIVDENGRLLISKNALTSDEGKQVTSQVPVQNFLKNTSEVSEYTSLTGNKMLGSWTTLAPTRWGLVAEIPFQNFSQSARDDLLVFLILLSILLALVVYEFTIFRSQLLRPLALFMTRINEFGKGNYKARVNLPVRNELLFLATVFNQMAENIDKDTSGIVERLRQIVHEQDVSAKLLVRRDIELTRANEKLRTLGNLKSEFVSTVAHQLRTPLSAIKWTLKMMIDGDVGPLQAEQITFLLKGYESNERLIGLVNDMLDVDRLESGTVVFNKVSVQIYGILQNFLLEIDHRAKEKNIKIILDTPFETLPKVRVDQAKMRAVIQNLIENSVKYTPNGGTVTVSLKEVNAFIVVSIADSGIGIPVDQQKQIFGRFFRGRNAVKTVTDGSGLGLFMVKQIVERHGGKIWFESTENKGTTFRFTIPID